MNKILIALDFGPAAEIVAEKGAALAKTMNAKITLLHVINNIAYYSGAPEYGAVMGFTGFNDISAIETAGHLKTLAEDYLDRVKKHLQKEDIKTIVEEGDTADVILQTAKQIDADIIVTGTHSRRWLEKILIGSVAGKVLNNTHIPLFVIPTRKENK